MMPEPVLPIVALPAVLLFLKLISPSLLIVALPAVAFWVKESIPPLTLIVAGPAVLSFPNLTPLTLMSRTTLPPLTTMPARGIATTSHRRQ